MVQLFWIINELMESGIVELLQLKNCGIRIYTGVCYGPAISFSRAWISDPARLGCPQLPVGQ
jgi:hypothetical protein